MAKAELVNVKEIKFFLQDIEHVLKANQIYPGMSLNTYLRKVLNLKGTKNMCLEGGCGSCIVTAEIPDPVTKKTHFFAVNSCLVSILSCHGWKIYTIEGIGGPLTGYHPIQQILAKFNGTQCGFCSSGMVMNMYALYKSGKLTMKEVENSFGGNICRCTGYRPILAAFKSLCKDASSELLGQFPDIEDIKQCEQKKCLQQCERGCKSTKNLEHPFFFTVGKSKWVKVYSFADLLSVLQKFAQSQYKLVAGNTAKGVYKSFANPVDLYIDIQSVPELKDNKIENGKLILGANTTLNSAIETFNDVSQKNTNFAYLKKLAEHIDLIANVPVRNIGTLAGNLMIKHNYNDFPSDVFLILETVGASITIAGLQGDEVKLSPKDFIKHDMNMKIIKKISLPSLQDNMKFESYKIMPRAQNAHAHVNAGFLFNFAGETLTSIRIVFGNISAEFVHATETEKFLAGKKLFDNNTLQQAYQVLDKELKPVDNPPDPSPEFRHKLAISLFYKAVLSVAPTSKVSAKFQSGGTKLERPISTAAQDYETNKSLYPLTQPVSKLEALDQTSGQAQYIGDMPDLPNQLFAVFVLAEAPPKSIIKKIDPSKALQVDGIVAFFDKDAIPGENTYMPKPLFSTKEEIFCSQTVLYYNQPLGILVGRDEDLVRECVKLVEVTYDQSKDPPLLTTRQILKANAKDRITELMTLTPKRTGDDVKHVVNGTFDIHQQYHFHMETQCCNVIPTENGLDVHPSTQWMDLIQVAISNMLKIPNNKVNINVRRCGGAFGAKISRNSLISCATALAAWKLRQPVKLSMSLPTNMGVIGKRWPLSTDYEVGVNDKGVIQYLEATHYTDLGIVSNETGMYELIELFIGNYNSDTFLIHMNSATTDTHPNTWCRAPGSCEGLASIEALMEHIAYSIGMDPLALREANVKDDKLLNYIKELKTWADLDKRKKDIQTFNGNNRWKKKGIAVVPMAYTMTPYGPYGAMVTIYHADGSVLISHSGIEIGQGINTKAAQVCAYKLGIPLEKVSVAPSNSLVGANSATTGGSVTSEAVCYGVIVACDKLLERMQPYREKMKFPTWENLVAKCFSEYVNLSALGEYSPKSPNVAVYTIYGIVATEVLLDVLTGQHLITRVDLIEDTGQSMSPEIDIGQVEGAFVMGLGYYTSEKIVYDNQGKILTDNTWTYYPPGPKDIPVDFRVKFPKKNINPVGVLKSKATAEPPLCLTVSVPLAIRNAVASARSDADNTKQKFYFFDGTTTVENIYMNSLNNYNQYQL